MYVTLYRGLTGLGAPLISYYLAQRLKRGKEDSARFAERVGRPGRTRPPGPLVWLHAASVGESLSMLPVVETIRARWPRLTVLVTTGTVTSAALMAERLPAGAVHQYVPVDRLGWVRAFLDHWRPSLALWTESEFWPNLVVETARRRIPMVLVNGRISQRSFQGWQRVPRLIRRLLGCFDLCLGQTEGDAERLRRLGATRTACGGNLKFAVPPLPADAGALAALETAVMGRAVWLAASTHPGEEAVAAEVHARVAAAHPGLLTVVAPRHPQRAEAIAAELTAAGLVVARRSTAEPITAATQIYLADTMGELGLFFRLAPVVFMGKSLTGEGGQNPLEPARLGRAVLYGPNMGNFEEINTRMIAAGAAEMVADAAGLAEAVALRLADGAVCARHRAAALAFATAEAGVLDAVMDLLAPYFAAAEAAHARA